MTTEQTERDALARELQDVACDAMRLAPRHAFKIADFIIARERGLKNRIKALEVHPANRDVLDILNNSMMLQQQLATAREALENVKSFLEGDDVTNKECRCYKDPEGFCPQCSMMTKEITKLAKALRLTQPQPKDTP